MTPTLRSVTARQLVSALNRDDWTLKRSRGSHRSFTKDPQKRGWHDIIAGTYVVRK